MNPPCHRHTATLAGLLALAGCSLAPAYHSPTTVPIADRFKEAPGWTPARPGDAAAKGEWWALFNDPVLDGLVRKVDISNQTVAQYRAAYMAARAMTRAANAALLPTVSASLSATRSGGTASASSGGGVSASGSSEHFSVGPSVSWEPDLWGKLGNTASQQRAGEQASGADLANATLSARGELATDYLQLRGIDAQRELEDRTIDGYQRALTITQNKYRAGTVSRSDVESASTSLDNARADKREFDRQRAALEHAMAVLVGENPSTFTIAVANWAPTIPAVPGVLESDLLQRRPDIAAAERRVAAANAGIGVQRAAYFPQLGLSANGSLSATSIGDLVSAPVTLWSLGLSAAQTLFDFGATRARVAQARAQFDQAAAVYRQTVLVAFQQVEDDLAGESAYADESALRDRAAVSADRAETIARNQYLAGTIDYAGVVVAQTAAYSARSARITAIVNRQTNAVALIMAIGGRWDSRPPSG